MLVELFVGYMLGRAASGSGEAGDHEWQVPSYGGTSVYCSRCGQVRNAANYGRTIPCKEAKSGPLQ